MSLAVIVPNYNKERYIKKCVESILCQSQQPDQIIIVDDCSTDGSVDIIKMLAMQHKSIVPVLLKKNYGVSNARNLGVKYASTDYITFLDSDDFYYNPDKLKNEMQILSKKNKMSLVYSKTVKVNENDNLINEGLANWRYLSGKVDIALIANYKCFSTLPRDYTMAKATFLQSGGYDPDRALYEDFELSMKLACSGVTFWYTGENGTAYRAVSGGLSNKNKKILSKEFRNLRIRYWKQYPTLVGKVQIVFLSMIQLLRRVYEFMIRRIGLEVDIK